MFVNRGDIFRGQNEMKVSKGLRRYGNCIIGKQSFFEYTRRIPVPVRWFTVSSMVSRNMEVVLSNGERLHFSLRSFGSFRCVLATLGLLSLSLHAACHLRSYSVVSNDVRSLRWKLLRYTFKWDRTMVKSWHN